MTKNYIAGFLIGAFALGGVGVASADSDDGKSLRERFESKVSKWRDSLDKRIEKFEKKTDEKIAKKEEKKDKGVSTTTPFVLEIGQRGKAFMRGEIVSAPASTSPSSMVVKSWGGNWTINVGSTTSVMSENRSLSDFKVGDYVGVEGKMNVGANFTIDASFIRDRTK